MRGITITFALAALPAALLAQVPGSRPSVIAGFEYQTLTFGAGAPTKKLTEMTVPLGVSVPVSQRLSIDAGTYFVRAERTNDSGLTATVSGLTDIVLRGAFQLKPDVAVLTLAINLPVGQGTLDVNQDSVSRVVASDLIPYVVSNFGTGFNVTTGLAFAAPLGQWALGLAGSYRYNGSYEPFANNAASLKPGGELRFRLGADRLVGQGRLSLGLTYSTFSNDEFGSNARSPGTRIIPQVSWSLPLGNNNLSLYAWDIYRNVAESAADSTIAKENTLTLGAIFAVRTGRNTLRPQVEFRQGMRGPGGLKSSGTLFGVGLRYAMATGSRMTLTPGVRFDTGSQTFGASSIGFTGFSGSLTLRTTL